MNESKIRIAMVGAGGMANGVHYPSLASFDDVEIAAICDLNKERLNTTADTYKVEKRYERNTMEFLLDSPAYRYTLILLTVDIEKSCSTKRAPDL